jgi:hypothetical protein
MKCGYSKSQNLMDALWSMVFVCVILFWLMFAYWYGNMSKAPVKITGYRCGVDNEIIAGQRNNCAIILERDLTRNCETDINVNFMNSRGEWPEGDVYRLRASDTAVKMANNKTPNEFDFSFYLNKSSPAGNSFLFGKAKFVCTDNPLHAFWPATIESVLPVQVQY